MERRRELTAADFMRDFALVHGNVATTGDRTREHVEKTSVGRFLKMSVSVKDQVPKLGGLTSEQEVLHGSITKCKEFLLARADLLKVPRHLG